MGTEKKTYGWVGKILRIDLTKREFLEVPTEEYAKRFIGGRGICAKVHWDEVLPTVGAFDPANVVTIMTGPLTGTPVATSGRVEIGGVSPQTYPNESFTRSSFGGWWGPELKYAGYDGLIIQGRSEKPVYLYIRDKEAQLRDASHLWGKGIYDTQEILWKELGEGLKPQILAIGPAGENLVRFAILMHGGASAAGQGGFGAVLGFKKLKAIVVSGTGHVEVARPKDLIDFVYEVNRWVYRPDDRPKEWSNIASFHRIGWSFFQGQKLRGWDWLKRYTRKGEACHACMLACRLYGKITDEGGRHSGAKCNQFWYEKYDLVRHGGLTDTFFKAAKIADNLGVNAFSLIGMIPWLVDTHKAKILDEKETGLRMADLGSLEFAKSLVEMITYRKGFGDILAEDSPRAADIVGKGSEKYLPHMNRGFSHHWDPWLHSPVALLWAMDSRHPMSAIHCIYWTFRFYHKDIWPAAGWATPEQVTNWAKEIFGTESAIDYSDENLYNPIHAYVAKWAMDYDALRELLSLCQYGPFPILVSWYSKDPYKRVPIRSPDIEAKFFTLVTGTNLMPDWKTGLMLGERVVSLERAIAVREGRTRKDDTLAARYFTEARSGITTGPGGKKITVKRAIAAEKFEKLKDEYYKLYGLDTKTGRPTGSALERHGLKDVVEQLAKEGLLG